MLSSGPTLLLYLTVQISWAPWGQLLPTVLCDFSMGRASLIFVVVVKDRLGCFRLPVSRLRHMRERTR